MNPPTLCPACLAELPDEYPYDHVEIDRALAGQAALFRRMSPDQQAEVVRTGLARGRSYASMSRLFMRSVNALTAMVGDGARDEFDQQVRALHAREFSDQKIAVHLGISYDKARKSRVRQHLPALYGPRGVRLTATKAVAA